MVFRKLLGMILVLVGLFFVIAMPGIMSGPGKESGGGGYQPIEFQHAIILIGLVMLGAGIFLLIKS